MRKLFIFLLALSYQCVNAQTYVRSFKDYPYAIIPQEFTIDNHSYYYSNDNQNDLNKPLNIYNEKYEIVRTIDLATLSPKINTLFKREKKNKEGKWIVESEESNERPFLLSYQYSTGSTGILTFFSQTLFSDDEKFEFYVPTNIQENKTIREYKAYDKDDEIDKRETTVSYLFSGVNVVSEDGTVLATFRAEGFYFKDSYITIRKTGNLFYFIFSTNDENNPYALYKVEKYNNHALVRKEGDLNNDNKVDVADHVELSKIIMNQNK